MSRDGCMSRCTERVVGVLQPHAKPGAAQAKLQAKGASNLLRPPTSLVGTRWAARRSCFGCSCWVGPVMWRHESSWVYVWVYKTCSGRATAAFKAWCSANKPSGQEGSKKQKSVHQRAIGGVLAGYAHHPQLMILSQRILPSHLK